MSDNLRDLRRVVNASLGPRQVIAIANGGDSEIVGRNLADLAAEIFRADNAVELMVHEERTRRGQLLGLLDAVRQWRREGRTFDSEGVALGIMLPGKGTRFSPITQRLHGIKPLMPMLVRQGRGRRWLNAAAASLYAWTLLAHHLQRIGFRGIAWKWGDEPQIAAHRLAEMNLDLSRADAVRFGAEVEVTEDLAVNKEWLLRHPTSGELIVQVQRRSRAELLQRFDIVDRGQPVKALVHIGSPAFSYPFLEEAEALFGDLDGWIDVDGYLFEALTHDADAWQAELNRDARLQQLVTERPDFWQRVQQLKQRVGERRGHPLVIKVIDFGEHLYWGDIGQLAKARRALWAVVAPTVEGDFSAASRPSITWLRIPTETASSTTPPEGWIALYHAVGPMRQYSIWTVLLDIDDPSKIIGRLPEPILTPDEHERDGYVPNVVYSCGSMIHKDELIIPYAIADQRCSVASVSVPELLSRLKASS